MSNKKRNLNVNEVLSMLEEDETFQGADVYIEPPDVNEDTDEDSGDEDEGGTASNLNGRQLAASASAIVYRDGQRQPLTNNSSDAPNFKPPAAPDVSDSETPDSPSDSDSVSSSDWQHDEPSRTKKATTKRKLHPIARQPGVKRKKPVPQSTRDWRQTDLSTRQKGRFPWNKPPLDLTNFPTSPVGLFELFFDREVLELITDYSKRYAQSKGNMNFTTCPEELQTFMAILLVSGYSQVPRRRMYWCSDEDVCKEAISSAMSRNRFEELMKYLHLSDNAELDREDKFSKVRPLLSILNEKLLAYFKVVETQNLSIDESMIPYYGRHGAKQFIRGKPIRFGYKMWVLTTPLGYTIQFEPYQGARGRQTEYPGVGMGGSVILDLISELQQESGCCYHLTFDNLFTSLQLIDILTEKNIGCTGTIRANRTGNCPLKDVNAMKKTARGTYDYATDMKTGLIVVRWNDNNIVNVASNVVGVHPIQQGKRWSRAESRQIYIPQPKVIQHYNQTMGGVDRMDQNVNKYRVNIRSKKWWWPLLAYCVDLCVQQSWHLYRATDEAKTRSMDLLEIRRTVARVYLARAPRTTLGRPLGFNLPMDKRVAKEVRFDRMDHLVEPWQTQLRCALCGLKTKHRCSKCKVGVHDKCFIRYHTK